MQRVHVSAHADTGICVAYDLHLSSVVHAITDYCIFQADHLQRKRTTLYYSTLRLARFWSFLLNKDRSLSSVNDEFLVRYRDAEYDEVMRDARHRNSERAAKSTVNQKLSTVLGWLVWLQATSQLPKDTIGPINCRVNARPVRARQHMESLLPGDALSSWLYYPDAGVGGSGPYVPEDLFERAVEFIMKNSKSDYIAHRDALFIDIARTSGFRRGSICSLTTQQFPRSKLEQWCEPTFPVTPTVQKRDYENTFEVPLELALRVLDFVDGPRNELVEGLRARHAKTDDHIFLSQRDGRPMLERSMTSSIVDAMRSAGAEKGKVIHALRGLFMTETVADEGVMRREQGLDTSTLSIALATAWKAGQRNPTSIVPYVARAQSHAARKRIAGAKKSIDSSKTSRSPQRQKRDKT